MSFPHFPYFTRKLFTPNAIWGDKLKIMKSDPEMFQIVMIIHFWCFE